MVDTGKRLTTNVFLLSSLSAVLSMAVHIFIALLLHLKTQQEFLTAQATLKRNEYLSAGQNESALQQRTHGPYCLVPGGRAKPFTCEKVVSPIRVTLPAEARQRASPSRLAFPSCLTHLM